MWNVRNLLISRMTIGFSRGILFHIFNQRIKIREKVAYVYPSLWYQQTQLNSDSAAQEIPRFLLKLKFIAVFAIDTCPELDESSSRPNKPFLSSTLLSLWRLDLVAVFVQPRYIYWLLFGNIHDTKFSSMQRQPHYRFVQPLLLDRIMNVKRLYFWRKCYYLIEQGSRCKPVTSRLCESSAKGCCKSQWNDLSGWPSAWMRCRRCHVFNTFFFLFFVPQKGYALSSASSYTVLCRLTDGALLDYERLIEPLIRGVQGSLSASEFVFTKIFRI